MKWGYFRKIVPVTIHFLTISTFLQFHENLQHPELGKFPLSISNVWATYFDWAICNNVYCELLRFNDLCFKIQLGHRDVTNVQDIYSTPSSDTSIAEKHDLPRSIESLYHYLNMGQLWLVLLLHGSVNKLPYLTTFRLKLNHYGLSFCNSILTHFCLRCIQHACRKEGHNCITPDDEEKTADTATALSRQNLQGLFFIPLSKYITTEKTDITQRTRRKPLERYLQVKKSQECSQIDMSCIIRRYYWT